jgi:integrase
MKRVARRKTGSVVLDKRRKTWNFLQWVDGNRTSKVIGPMKEFPTKGEAWRAALSFNQQSEVPKTPGALRVSQLIGLYRAEKMPQRYSTRRGYEVWLRNYILPRWGTSSILDVQAWPVELWLNSLQLSPKSRAEVRGLLRILWDFAMLRRDIATERNPMELVTIKNASKRARQPRSLTVEEFQKFIPHLREPFRTMALLCVCFGLRISECLALKWSDVNWLGGKLHVQRGIVRQRVDDLKTIYSEKQMSIDAGMLDVLKAWKQAAQFTTAEDWMFASPVKIGRQPWSYDQVWRSFLKAGATSGIGKLGTHSMRHTYRSWLDAVGTPIAVQQKLMRHADIRTTMNVYGSVVTDEMAQAHSKVVCLALNGLQTDRKPS